MMPALQKAKTATLEANGLRYVSVSLPKQQRETRVEKNMAAGRDCTGTGGVDGSGVSTMETILVLTHVDESGAALTRASLEAVTAGAELSRRMGAALPIGILGSDAEAAAGAVAATGARLLAVSGEAFAQARYAIDAAGCEALCRAAQASIVLAPASARFARVAAGVAHRLGGVIDTHITDVQIAATTAVERSRRRGGSIASGWRR